MSERCEGCGDDVRIAGGIGDIWTLNPASTGGMTLEFADDSEFFLCFDCIDALPDEPVAGDVAALGD
ncbi:DUF7561 family protein [Halobacterium bonnevillei]|uniref:Small CPxCG-related zinc finger protein n=1 Tax=Halobacterium bonnevillei TaxID=2692200 RepID=A0A6B0SH87_9EURY|nr:hypothetical protein [Halobacterium bonnevillei]MXR20397.1 hypothetical protein [Halobacterium bonnevillei]